MADLPDITETFLEIDLALTDTFLAWTEYSQVQEIELTDDQLHYLYNFFRMAFCEGELRLWAKCAPMLVGKDRSQDT